MSGFPGVPSAAFASAGASYDPSTSYNPFGGGPPSSVGALHAAVTANAATAPKPPFSISDPLTGREAADAQLAFQSLGGHTVATGTAQQLLGQFAALLKANGDRTRGEGREVVGEAGIDAITPSLVLPGG